MYQGQSSMLDLQEEHEKSCYPAGFCTCPCHVCFSLCVQILVASAVSFTIQVHQFIHEVLHSRLYF